MMSSARGRLLSAHGLALVALALTLATGAFADDRAAARQDGVSGLGRIEPEHGIVRLGVPSTPEAISFSCVKSLTVEAGDDVTEGQLLAETDSAPLMKAKLSVAEAELALAQNESEMARGLEQEACSRADVARRTAARRSNLLKKGAASDEEADVAASDAKALSGSCDSARVATKVAASKVDVATAGVEKAKAELDRTQIRAPFAGRVLEVRARPGAMVGLDGILDLGRTSRMYAIAEIYETDIGRVRLHQKATVTSTALEGPLTGQVERIRPKVRKQDATGTDPAARKDARIVEVEVLLDHPEAVSSLTNLQVEVRIQP